MIFPEPLGGSRNNGDDMTGKNESFLRRCLNMLYLGSAWLGAGFIASICLLVVCQVCFNLLDRLSGLFTGQAIGLTIPSYADFTGFFLVAASFLALAYTLKMGGHIRVSLVIANLNKKIRHIFEVWCLLLASSATIYFSWYTFLLVRDSHEYNDLSSGMVAVPLWIPQSAMLIGLLILSIALLDELILSLFGKKPSYVGAGENLLGNDDESTPEHHGERTCRK
ncbi:MAG: TRAP transporter small permease [Desulfopila sp.]|jgi:TRAP-type C4-dicarboxylate transport system permease small subunit|nr:TRAP transporter small permease [Desulfopila sp.]